MQEGTLLHRTIATRYLGSGTVTPAPQPSLCHEALRCRNSSVRLRGRDQERGAAPMEPPVFNNLGLATQGADHVLRHAHKLRDSRHCT